MNNPPLFLILCTDTHEKLHMGAMMASIAAVSARPVRVLVSMSALLRFRRDLSATERYGASDPASPIHQEGVPDTLELLRQGRAAGDLTIHACSMAMDALQLTLDALEEDLFDGEQGLTSYMIDAQEGQLVVI